MSDLFQVEKLVLHPLVCLVKVWAMMQFWFASPSRISIVSVVMAGALGRYNGLVIGLNRFGFLFSWLHPSWRLSTWALSVMDRDFTWVCIFWIGLGCAFRFWNK